MAHFSKHPPEGYEDAILIPELWQTISEHEAGLSNLVQNNSLLGHDKEDRMLISVTSTRSPHKRVPNVPIATIKLCFFPFSMREKPEYG
ncbi:hypothetical protein Tco_0397508 [Tanacetum coccineum]|uniref:Uncharacterized protein n=1 Tax=Tanacetum coccineum TaxID=301880 RepID=A0ABQ5HQU3_9ASTR